MTAFRQVVAKLQDGQREEAMIGLEFVLRLDPSFRPAHNLQQQLASGAAEIDLSGIISELQAPTTDNINLLLIEAVEAFEAREFQAARDKVDAILKDLPGHKDARHLLGQIDDALKVETQVEQFLGQARETLAGGDPQEAANFVMMAQALDPHHHGISETLATIRAAGGIAAVPAPSPHREAIPPSTDGPAFGDLDDRDVRFDTLHDSTPSFDGPDSGAGFAPDEFTAPSDDHGPAFGDGPDPFADVVGTDSGPMWQGGEPETEPEPSDDRLFEATGGDVSDLFEAPSASDAGPAVAFEDASGDDTDQDPVARLLRRGDNAFEAQDFAAAVHAWSRILLLDPAHREASDRIAGARVSLEAQRRRVDQLLTAAREASAADDAAGAMTLVTEALELDPTVAAAGALRDRLQPAPSAPAPPDPTLQPAVPEMPAVPELEDDLFREEGLGDLSMADLGGARHAEPSDGLPELPDLPPERRRFRLPVRTLAIAAAGLVVVLVGAWLGLRIFSGGGGTEVDTTRVNEAITQARALADQGQVEAGLDLLRGLEVDDLSRQRVDEWISRLEAQLAPPTPTPIPEAIGRAEQLVLEDRFLDAYATVTGALERYPRDGGLVALRDDILSVEPRLASLHTALVENRYDAALALALELEEQHPDWPDVTAAANRSLFNAALAQMRTYNLTAAESYLRQLDSRSPDDPEVARVLEFVERYKARSVDMQLRIFIRSLKER